MTLNSGKQKNREPGAPPWRNNLKNLKPGLVLVIGLVLGVLAVGGAGAALYFQAQLAKLQDASSKELGGLKESEDILAKVGELIVLPSDEKPTIATVTDPERLQNQAFFQKAKKGDKVLIFSAAQKAILYDPLANKIVEVAPINAGVASTTTAP